MTLGKVKYSPALEFRCVYLLWGQRLIGSEIQRERVADIAPLHSGYELTRCLAADSQTTQHIIVPNSRITSSTFSRTSAKPFNS
jgi:hypothetical protein